jgi:hypothetical protein
MQTPNYMNNTVVVSNNNFDNSLDNNSLDANEMAGLLYMREEEKVAHDVYVTLYQQWGLPVFNNIANSETRHQSKVAELLDNYQIPHNIDANPVGVFVNPDLQQLYNNLVLQGSQSLTEALKVGVLIEETDIADLQEKISQTDNLDIQQVYNNLLNASYNHLNSFSSNLTGVINTGINPLPNQVGQVQPIGTDDILTGGGRGRGNQGNRGGGYQRFAGNGQGNSFSYDQNYDVSNDFLLTTPSPVGNNLPGYTENPQGVFPTWNGQEQAVTLINPLINSVPVNYPSNNFVPSPTDLTSGVSLIPNNTW